MNSQDIRITPVGGTSFVRGVQTTPLLEITIGAQLRNIASRYPQHEALVVRHQDVRWTWSELDALTDKLAAGLLRLGLERGDRIAIWAPNCAEWVLIQFATAKAGLILVNINPAYRRSELEYALNKVGCRALVLAPKLKTSDYLEILGGLAPELGHSKPGELNAAALPQLRWAIRLGTDATPGMLNFDSLLGEPSQAEREALGKLGESLSPNDPINIQFTSGTTGLPKGATLTHRNILNNGFFNGQALRLNENDRICIPVPLYHCFGMVIGNLAAVTHGAAMVYPAEAFEPASVLAAIQAERCTALYGVPTMFIAELGHPDFDKYDLSSLRTGIMAGSPCPIEVMRQTIDRMHMRDVTIAYGMTETSPVSFQSSADDPVERRVSTVGRIHPHVEVKIVDADGRIVPCGEPGELCTRGYSVMPGYWEDPVKTAEAIVDGWMHTGDLGTIDAEGYCSIVGRAKDMIIRGGENVYPREVEEFLYRHPKIQDVQCIGVPDAKFGEVLCACVILKPGATADEAELRQFCQGEIAYYKVPQYVRFVDSFPMTVTGKIQKFVLRDQVSAELGLKAAKTA